jgi:DNA-binding FadR family transcriptional regulator
LSTNGSNLLHDLTPLPRATLSEQVAKALAERIIRGDWKRGEKLPSESELCRALNVGRSSLREALTSLSFIGLIRAQAGGGRYIAEQPAAYASGAWLSGGQLNDEKSLNEFAEARLILGTEMAGLCADRISDRELAGLKKIVDEMKRSTADAEAFGKLDFAFHAAISSAAKNKVLNSILTGVREQTMELIKKSLLLDEGISQALRQHIKIYEAIKERNPAKAREAMRNHLHSFQVGYKVLFAEKHAARRSSRKLPR